MLVILLEDRVSGPSSQAQGDCKLSEVPWWNQMCGFCGSPSSRSVAVMHCVWPALKGGQSQQGLHGKIQGTVIWVMNRYKLSVINKQMMASIIYFVEESFIWQKPCQNWLLLPKQTIWQKRLQNIHTL